jgi:F0F1-type ATP synthase delta subunit
MKTPRHQIAAALARRSLATTDGKALAAEIAAYLLDEHRTNELNSLLRDVSQYRADHGIVEVVAVSAFDLSDSVRTDITMQVREMFPDSREIIISHQPDESVIGGVRLEFPNQQLDLSVRSKLNRLKQLTNHA